MAVPEALTAFRTQATRRLQYWLDKSTPHVTHRWLALAGLVAIYVVRVWLLQGFYIVTYGLGIYNLTLFLGFLTPLAENQADGPELPTKNDEEFRPFVRRLPEFKFWCSCFKSFLVGLTLTLFPIFDVPVFWPILLIYWIALFLIQMKRQIKHMIKYRYLPWNFGKKTYSAKPLSPAAQ